jgi:outer membrane immunogenic protein
MRRLGLWALVASAVAAAGAVATTASAADLPAPGTSYYPPVAYQPALYNWSGLYLGGQVGLGILEDTVTQTTTALLTTGTTSKITDTGLLGGVQVGANYELAPWVIGVEASWVATNISGAAVTGSTLVPGNSERSATSARWYVTGAGRIGYAMNTLLIYAKGGAAWLNADYQQGVINTLGVLSSFQSLSANRTGFLVGGGIEYGMTEHISARFEYDFLDFGSKTYYFNGIVYPTAGGGTATGIPVSITSYTHQFTTGLNFRFN